MMEEPVPCAGCDEIVELHDCSSCKGCRRLFCPGCLRNGVCATCAEECESCAETRAAPTGGTFTLTRGDRISAPLAYNAAPPREIQAGMDGMSPSAPL